MSRTAFVSGATGFVGLNLVERLMTDGWDVTALHRPSSDLAYLSRFGPRLAVGEVTDASSLIAALPSGTDTVFHVAGNTSMWRREDARQTRDNVVGTHNIVEAALTAGVRRLVVTSSISAYGPVTGEVTEETPSRAETSTINYERTKWRAQEIARAATARGLEVVILQPGAILGPYDLGTWSWLFPAVRDGKLPGAPPARLTFAHVREVVAAHVAAADRGENGGQYILGGENAPMIDLVGEIARLVGRPPPSRETPFWLIRLLAAIGEAAAAVTGREPQITREMTTAMASPITATSAKAQRELGYRIVPLREMVRDCHDWLVAEGRL